MTWLLRRGHDVPGSLMVDIVRCCPLCGSSEGPVVETMEYSRIWAELERRWSPHFPADLVSRHTPAPHTNLRECAECGLRYVAPCVAGDGEFYERLMDAAGYEGDRWEFGEVATRLRPGADVLDVGCGLGAFLQLIESSAGHVVGLDTNRAAISELRGRGIEAEVVSIAESSPRFHPSPSSSSIRSSAAANLSASLLLALPMASTSPK